MGFNLGFSSVSTAMDNSMGQIVPMTSMALSQSMDSVNTATNEEEVSVFSSISVLSELDIQLVGGRGGIPHCSRAIVL